MVMLVVVFITPGPRRLRCGRRSGAYTQPSGDFGGGDDNDDGDDGGDDGGDDADEDADEDDEEGDDDRTGVGTSRTCCSCTRK